MSGWHGCCVLFLIVFGTADAIFKIKIASLKKCNITASKMDTSGEVEYNMGVHKVNRQTTLIRANFTIGKKVGPMSISYRSYEIKQSNAKDLVMVLHRVSCKNPAAFQFTKLIKVNIDKDCYVYPGSYVVDDINLDDFAWLFTNSMVNPGRYSYDIEIETKKGIVACISLACDIVNMKQ